MESHCNGQCKIENLSIMMGCPFVFCKFNIDYSEFETIMVKNDLLKVCYISLSNFEFLSFEFISDFEFRISSFGFRIYFFN